MSEAQWCAWAEEWPRDFPRRNVSALKEHAAGLGMLPTAAEQVVKESKEPDPDSWQHAMGKLSSVWELLAHAGSSIRMACVDDLITAATEKHLPDEVSAQAKTFVRMVTEQEKLVCASMSEAGMELPKAWQYLKAIRLATTVDGKAAAQEVRRHLAYAVLAVLDGEDLSQRHLPPYCAEKRVFFETTTMVVDTDAHGDPKRVPVAVHAVGQMPQANDTSGFDFKEMWMRWSVPTRKNTTLGCEQLPKEWNCTGQKRMMAVAALLRASQQHLSYAVRNANAQLPDTTDNGVRQALWLELIAAALRHALLLFAVYCPPSWSLIAFGTDALGGLYACKWFAHQLKQMGLGSQLETAPCCYSDALSHAVFSRESWPQKHSSNTGKVVLANKVDTTEIEDWLRHGADKVMRSCADWSNASKEKKVELALEHDMLLTKEQWALNLARPKLLSLAVSGAFATEDACLVGFDSNLPMWIGSVLEEITNQMHPQLRSSILYDCGMKPEMYPDPEGQYLRRKGVSVRVLGVLTTSAGSKYQAEGSLRGVVLAVGIRVHAPLTPALLLTSAYVRPTASGGENGKFMGGWGDKDKCLQLLWQAAKSMGLDPTRYYALRIWSQANKDQLSELEPHVQPLADCLPTGAAYDTVGGIWSVDELKAMSTVPLWHRPPPTSPASHRVKRSQEEIDECVTTRRAAKLRGESIAGDQITVVTTRSRSIAAPPGEPPSLPASPPGTRPASPMSPIVPVGPPSAEPAGPVEGSEESSSGEESESEGESEGEGEGESKGEGESGNVEHEPDEEEGEFEGACNICGGSACYCLHCGLSFCIICGVSGCRSIRDLPSQSD